LVEKGDAAYTQNVIGQIVC